MADELGPDTNEKMLELCKKISVAHDLDAEIQEELRSHMEDKLLGYLNGEETLAEEDAFILVREHFGEPSALKGMLQGVYSVEVQVSLARRLAAAMIVSAGAALASVMLVFTLMAGRGNENVVVVLFLRFSAPVIIQFMVLRRWQRQLDSGGAPWFLTWRPGYFLGAAAILLLLPMYLPMPGVNWAALLGTELPNLSLLVVISSPLASCMVWFWWCDRAPRTTVALGITAGFWVIWETLLASGNASSILRAGLVSTDSRSVSISILYIILYIGVHLLMPMMFAFAAYGAYEVARRVSTGLTQWSEARR